MAAVKGLPGTADSGEGRREGRRMLAADAVEGCLRQVLPIGMLGNTRMGWRGEGGMRMFYETLIHICKNWEETRVYKSFFIQCF